MNPCNQNHDRQKGALLIEVLVSILIFSFAILGLIALQARAVQFSVEAEDRSRAALLANEMASTMWMLKTVSATTLTSQISDWEKQVRAALPPYDSTVTASVKNLVENGATSAEITITWKALPPQNAPRKYVTRVTMP